MRRLRSMRNSAGVRIFSSRGLVALALVLTLLLSGCGLSQTRSLDMEKQDDGFDLNPCRQKNGEPFHIAVVDMYPPIESSYLWLRGLTRGLQDAGYISADVDLSEAPENFTGFYRYLVKQDLGAYIQFDEEYYLVGTDNDEAVGKKLRDEVARGELQIVAATGTDPGLFLKELDLGIPFLVSLATDPIASGIIESEEDSGDDNIWALVEPNVFFRQFEAYHTMMGFEKLGLITVEEYDIIAGNNDYRAEAKTLGVELRSLSFSEDVTLSENYTEVLLEKLESFDMSDLDGILFAFGAVYEEQAAAVAELLNARKIPFLIADGDNIVKNGALINLAVCDYEGYGYFASMVMSNIFHGQTAREQPCVYVSAPRIVLNLATAKKIGFPTPISLLRSADVIFRGEA